MKGTWAASGNAADPGAPIFGTISTTVPLLGQIEGVVKAPGALIPGLFECPASGSATDPKPAEDVTNGNLLPGVLCLYTDEKANLDDGYLSTKLQVSKGGAVLELKAAAAGPSYAFGSWAMAAPGPPPAP